VAEQGLFRANAVKQQSARLDGDVIIAQPLSTTLLTVILVGVVLALLTFLSLASFNRKETVTGYLKPDMGLAKVMSPRSGVIQQVFIEDGQQVQAGDRLALLSMPDNLAIGDSLSSTLQQGIQQQIALVSQRREQVITQFNQQASEYQSAYVLVKTYYKIYRRSSNYCKRDWHCTCSGSKTLLPCSNAARFLLPSYSNNKSWY